jgi:GTPase SAR1 family protein
MLYRCVVIGDACARKTELLSLFTRGHLPDEYAPSIFDEQVSEIQYVFILPVMSNIEIPFIPLSYRADESPRVEDQELSLILSDVTGAEEYENYIGTILSGADIVIICFLQCFPPEDENLGKWRDSVKRYCLHARCLLAGIMGPGSEIHADRYMRHGKKLAADLGIPSYVQCNLEKGPSLGGVDDLFETVGSLGI